MKNSIIRLFTLLFIASSFIFNANAQQQTQQQQQKQSNLTPEQRVDKHLQKMKTELNLTDEQVPKVKAVLMERLNTKEVKMGEGNPEEAKESHKQMMADLGKILTPEQMTKFKEMQANAKNKAQGNAPANNQPAK